MTMAKFRIAHEASLVTDAVVLVAVVFLAVAPFANILFKDPFLF